MPGEGTGARAIAECLLSACPVVVESCFLNQEPWKEAEGEVELPTCMDYSECIGFCEPGDANGDCTEKTTAGVVAEYDQFETCGTLYKDFDEGGRLFSVVLSRGTSCLHGGSDPVHLREVLNCTTNECGSSGEECLEACEKNQSGGSCASPGPGFLCAELHGIQAYGRIDSAMFAGGCPDVLDAYYDFPFEGEEAADGGEGAAEERGEGGTVVDAGIVFPEHLAVQCSRYPPVRRTQYTKPSGSEDWRVLPMRIPPCTHSASRTVGRSFRAVALAGTANVYFKFENAPFPDTEPSFTTEMVSVEGIGAVHIGDSTAARRANL